MSLYHQGYTTLAVATILTLSVSCRVRTSDESRSKSSTRGDIAEYEVTDCGPSLCTADTEIVNLNPSDRDLAAFGMRDSAGSFALDDGGAVQEVQGSDAESALEKSRAAQDVLKDALGEGRQSTATKVGIAGLFASISSISSQAATLSKFTNDNIIAATPDQRAKTIKKILSFASKVRGLLPALNPDKVESLLEALGDFGGKDGWVNHGDLPRFLPVIPNLVGRVADQKISEGYAEGIANLAKSRPFVYKRWTRNPRGIIGSVVQKNIDKELNAAYSQKYAAIRSANEQFQGAYNRLMSELTVTSYFLNANDGRAYYDPGNSITEDQINRLSVAISGRSLDDVMREAANNQTKPSAQPMNFPVLEEIASQITLPDGIPISDIIKLANDSDGFTKSVMPEFLVFKLLENGKLEIRRKSR
jgi:hypothetical protein